MSKLKLLLDSCVAREVADRLRADGHDVVAIADRGPDPGDPVVLDIAVREGRALVTIDHDFGALVFRDGAQHLGVLRLRAAPAAAQSARALQLLDTHRDDLAAGSFVTDDGDRVRVTTR